MDKNFSGRFKIIYAKYCAIEIEADGRPSESALARFLDVSQTTVQRWKNSQIPGPESLKAIHDKLGFAYDWLIAGEGEMYDTTVQKLAEQEAEIRRLRKQATNEPALARAAGQE